MSDIDELNKGETSDKIRPHGLHKVPFLSESNEMRIIHSLFNTVALGPLTEGLTTNPDPVMQDRQDVNATTSTESRSKPF